eukprot:365527-Chlamydomonas_euryale.AAC.4
METSCLSESLTGRATHGEPPATLPRTSLLGLVQRCTVLYNCNTVHTCCNRGAASAYANRAQTGRPPLPHPGRSTREGYVLPSCPQRLAICFALHRASCEMRGLAYIHARCPVEDVFKTGLKRPTDYSNSPM